MHPLLEVNQTIVQTQDNIAGLQRQVDDLLKKIESERAVLAAAHQQVKILVGKLQADLTATKQDVTVGQEQNK